MQFEQAGHLVKIQYQRLARDRPLQPDDDLQAAELVSKACNDLLINILLSKRDSLTDRRQFAQDAIAIAAECFRFLDRSPSPEVLDHGQ